MMSAGTSDKQRVLKRQRNVRLAQLDRAFGYGPKGRGFESSNARYVERLETLKNQWFLAFFVLVKLSSNL